MKLLIKLLLSVGLAFVTVMLGCTSDVAGGSGVGNPTTEVALSMSAVNYDSLTAMLAKKLHTSSESDMILKKGIDNPKKSTTHFSVTSACITVARVKLFSQTDETSYVDGPFMFDAITGESEPSLVSVDMPSGSYSGISLLVTKQGKLSTDEYAIDVAGTFDYLDETRAFSIRLTCNLVAKYPLENGTLELVPDGKMNIEVVLDADQWLTGTSIVDCIDSGSIELQDDGSLLIEDTIAPGPCHSDVNVIRRNILDSGELKLL